MQTTHKIEASSATSYAEYLTSTSNRADYYTNDGKLDPNLEVPSQWHGSTKVLKQLGLSPGATITTDDLVAVMNGNNPVTEKPLRPAGSNGERVAGIELMMAPPKTVSALWATASPERRAQIEAAHRQATASALKRTEREVALVRRTVNRVKRFEKARSLLAGELIHTSSRLAKDQERGGIPDPQLHSHVILLAAERKDGKLAAIESKQLYRSARENGAWYRAEMAANLQELGVQIDRRTGNGERYFEVAGVPDELASYWSKRAEDVHRAANLFRQRYGREPRAGELGSLTTKTRGSKSAASNIDINHGWRTFGAEKGLSREQNEELFSDRNIEQHSAVDLRKELLKEVTRERSMINNHELKAKAYELATGVCRPADADRLIEELERSGELLKLEDGSWTTRELRELEEATVAIADQRADEIAAPVSEQSLKQARREVGKQIKGSLTKEQRDALALVTGPGGIAVLVGPAGTGKGIVISTAARAWQLERIEVIGISVAGEVAQRLQNEARLDASYSADDLNYGIKQDRIRIGPNTVVIFDEAAMADHDRIAPLIKLTAARGAKPLLVGDAAQISSIGPGGLFAALEGRVPTAELKEVHRANHQWEREAWQQIRAGEPGPPLAQYQAHDRMHINDTRAESAEAMVANWDETRKKFGGRAVMITDASNLERDQMNDMAQERRIAAGELGAHEVELPGKPYGLRAGDEIIFTAKFPVPGQERIKNGVSATVIDTSREKSKITIRTNELEPREVEIDTSKFDELSLSYAVHVNKGQGITAETSGILIGGWQTHKENAYVTLTRSREETRIFVSREDLGEQGLDSGAMERLAEKMKRSRAQEASITKKLAERQNTRERGAERQPPPEHARKQSQEREQPAEWARPGDEAIDDFLDPRGERAHGRSVEDDFVPGDHADHTQHEDRIQRDARERFTEYQHAGEPASPPIDIRTANPADIQIGVFDTPDVRLAYTQQPYSLHGYTGEPRYALFGGWQSETEQGFVVVTQGPHGTDVQSTTEDRGERPIEHELRERVEQVIERTQSRHAGTPEQDHERQPEPVQPELTDRVPDHQPALDPLDHDPDRDHQRTAELSEQDRHLQPQPEPVERDPQPEPGPDHEQVERDPYIQEAIEAERDRQQAFEQEQTNDLGIDME